ncbi:MAG: alpha/beta fold hydrolase [Deltaproteobacteria bacterium]|nr:alpha/beta fold hydrolase [Deltaproteobacteria bacterium]
MSAFFFLLILVLFSLLFFPLLTYALFWYEAGNSDYRLQLQRDSEGRMATWILRGLFSSIRSQIPIILFFPLGLFRRLWEPDAEEGPPFPPLILIHGLYHNPSAWLLFRARLRRAGLKRIHVASYDSRRFSFQEIAEQVAGRLGEIGTMEGNKPVLLVGHSLGGLLAKAYAARKEGLPGPAVKGIITLGTPFKGSKMTVFGLGRLARDISHNSGLIKELERMEVSAHTACAALYSPVDNIVLPHDSLAAAPENWIREKTAPISHVAYLYDKSTFNRVLVLLSQFAGSSDQNAK